MSNGQREILGPGGTSACTYAAEDVRQETVLKATARPFRHLTWQNIVGRLSRSVFDRAEMKGLSDAAAWPAHN
jgi:hypothetical protein